MEQEDLNNSANYSEKFGSELFTIWNINGEQQLETIRTVEKLLWYLKSKDSNIKALSVPGSTFKGFATKSDGHESDLDICLIYSDPDADELPGSKTSIDVLYEYITEFQKTCSIEIHPISEVNLAKLDKSLVLKYPGIAISGLVFPIFGANHYVDETIQAVRSIVGELSPQDKEHWVEIFTNDIMTRQFTQKPLERMSFNADHEDVRKEYVDHRRKLYEERIRGLFIN